jgi:hypothetical protein
MMAASTVFQMAACSACLTADARGAARAESSASVMAEKWVDVSALHLA